MRAHDPSRPERRPQRAPGRPPRPPAPVGNHALARVLQRARKRKGSTKAAAPKRKRGTFSYAVDDLGRPTFVDGPVRPTGVAGRGATALPSAYGGDPTAGLLGHDGGHVIGLHLGGENVSQNVVPMLPRFNRGVWKNLEDELKDWLVDHGGAGWMTVNLDYDGDSVMPTTLSVSCANELDDDEFEGALSQPDDIEVVPALSPLAAAPFGAAPTALTVLSPELGLDMFLASDFATTGPTDTRTDVQRFIDYVNAHHVLPKAARAAWPDAPANRPYGALDVMRFNGQIADGTSMGPGRDFSEAQRRLILQVNKSRNAGALMSDDPNDTVYTDIVYGTGGVLDERGSWDAPEIDHIIPKSRGGGNFYGNARVVSWELNNRDARVKPLGGLVDLSRLALPILSGRFPLENARIVVDYFLARTPATTTAFSLGDVRRAVTGWFPGLDLGIVTRLGTALEDRTADPGDITGDAASGFDRA